MGRVFKIQAGAMGLAAAKQQTEILKSNYEQATANVVGLTAQVAFNRKRLGTFRSLRRKMPTHNSRRRTARINTRRR
jgi:hypothetical protein